MRHKGTASGRTGGGENREDSRATGGDRRAAGSPTGVASLWRLPYESDGRGNLARRAWRSRRRPAVLAAASGMAALALIGGAITSVAIRRRRR
ncbi:hypothetical protein HS041_32395 [Planomonospora sp. ID67723]|uniref:hypothetical protein n=1 Tax=Planomonospora sp. ID67723 TaxID=2738134 RepID=UPI0018C417BF|nr:hypothetical protein [Planomonospora sp. ID67723]MBG0832408.1 hypothetical protein [Planomonospora sp. ID67723]